MATNNSSELKIKRMNEGKSIANSSLVTYAILTFFSIIALHSELTNISASFLWGSYKVDNNIALATLSNVHRCFLISAIAFCVLYLISKYFESNFKQIALIKNILSAPLSTLSKNKSIVLCIASSIAEELFFRVTLVPITGFILAAIIYTIIHIPPSGLFSIWSLEVFLTGMVLGFIYENSGSLLAVVFPHLLLNIVSMYRYKKEWSKHGTRAFISKFPLLNSKGNS